MRLRALKSVESSTPTAVVPARRRRRASRPRISDLDREVLAFAAEHRFIICAHVQALLRCSEQMPFYIFTVFVLEYGQDELDRKSTRLNSSHH